MYWIFRILTLVAMVILVITVPEGEWEKSAIAGTALIWSGFAMLDYKIEGLKGGRPKDADE